jgi:hypothetical protein
MKAHIAIVCFKRFRHFRGMMQLFYMDVTKVDRGCYTCCKSFQRQLQVFQWCCSKCYLYSRGMLQAFRSRCYICFTHMLQQYIQNVSTVFNLVLQ